jgi:hypothetical protein
MSLRPLAPEASASASSATSAVEIFPGRNGHYNPPSRGAFPRGSPYDGPVTRAPLLWILLSFFTLRVLGQLLVVAGIAPFLPPLDDWQSGLLPYPVLLSSQILILGILATVCVQFSRGQGYFVRRQWLLATPLWVVGWIYAIGMVVRYALLRRDAIPVVFHIVLASFLLVVAQHHRRQG